MKLQKPQIYIALMLALFPAFDCFLIPETTASSYLSCIGDESRFSGFTLSGLEWCPLNHFTYSRNYTQCFGCSYDFMAHFHRTQKKFFVNGIGQFDRNKKAVGVYASKTLGDGLERVRHWKASKLLLEKELNVEFTARCTEGCCLFFIRTP